jgi:threonine/homoserine/homoserine lactone efflux protein
MWTASDKATDPYTPISKESSLLKSYSLGLLTQLSNPKTAIVIGGIIMAFLPAEVPPYSFWIIGIMAFMIDAGWYCTVSLALSTNKAQRLYNRFKQHINRVAGSLMALMGTKLALNL